MTKSSGLQLHITDTLTKDIMMSSSKIVHLTQILCSTGKRMSRKKE